MRKLLLFLGLFYLVFACEKAGSSELSYYDEAATEAEGAEFDSFDEVDLEDSQSAGLKKAREQVTNPSTNQKETPDKTPSIKKRIIKTGHLTMQVKSVDSSTAQIYQTVNQFDAYISGQNLTSNNYEIRNTFTIRVPIEQFDALMNNLAGQGTYIKQRQISSKDVTAEFVDIEIRLKTKKEVRDRYIDILRKKAKTVEEVLQAEEAIREVQEEIESREGRLRYLKDQTSLSTIYLNIYETVDYTPEPVSYRKTFGSRIVDALENGWEFLQLIFIGLLTIWPLLIIFGLLIWQRKRLFKSRNKKSI